MQKVVVEDTAVQPFKEGRFKVCGLCLGKHVGIAQGLIEPPSALIDESSIFISAYLIHFAQHVLVDGFKFGLAGCIFQLFNTCNLHIGRVGGDRYLC